MSGTQVLERPQGQVQDESLDHIVCMCNPEWSICGRLALGPLKDWNSSLCCPLCDAAYFSNTWHCPTCGCGNQEVCERCDE